MPEGISSILSLTSGCFDVHQGGKFQEKSQLRYPSACDLISRARLASDGKVNGPQVETPDERSISHNAISNVAAPIKAHLCELLHTDSYTSEVGMAVLAS